MAALDFPSNPTNGQTYEQYVYDTSITAWRNQGSPSGLAGQVVALDNKMGLKNIVPPTVTIASGTGSTNAIGKVSFTNATSVRLDGVFSTKYRHYRMIALYDNSDDNVDMAVRFCKNGTAYSASDHMEMASRVTATGSVTAYSGNGDNRLYFGNGSSGGRPGSGTISADISNPAHNTRVSMRFMSSGWYPTASAYTSYTGTGLLLAPDVYDGIVIFPTIGTFSGSIIIYGYNEQV